MCDLIITSPAGVETDMLAAETNLADYSSTSAISTPNPKASKFLADYKQIDLELSKCTATKEAFEREL